MSLLTLPQARIPLGWTMVNGQRTAVEIDIEWMRAFITLVERAGGVNGSSTTDLSTSAFEDAGIEDVKAGLYSGLDGAGQAPIPLYLLPPDTLAADVATLTAQLAELTKEVGDLKQGTFL